MRIASLRCRAYYGRSLEPCPGLQKVNSLDSRSVHDNGTW